MTEDTPDQVSTHTPLYGEEVRKELEIVHLEWIRSQAYVQRNVIAFVLFPEEQKSKLIHDLPYYADAIKAAIQIHALRITGLADGSLLNDDGSIEYDAINPVFTFGEKYGKPIYNLFEKVQHLNRCNLPSPKTQLRTASKTNDSINFEILFVEPDPTHAHVLTAWKLVDIYVKSVRGDDGRRDLEKPLNDKYRTVVTFGGTTVRGQNVFMQAQDQLGNLTTASINSYGGVIPIQQKEDGNANIHTAGNV